METRGETSLSILYRFEVFHFQGFMGVSRARLYCTRGLRAPCSWSRVYRLNPGR
jgi:hypothetical protein